MTGDWLALKEAIQWLASTGILSALIWYFEHKTQRREQLRDKKAAEDMKRREERQREVDERDAARQKELDKRERKRDETLDFILKESDVALNVSTATARAVQRIPDAHCNGDMSSALAEADEIRKEKDERFRKATIKEAHEEGGNHETE